MFTTDPFIPINLSKVKNTNPEDVRLTFTPAAPEDVRGNFLSLPESVAGMVIIGDFIALFRDSAFLLTDRNGKTQCRYPYEGAYLRGLERLGQYLIFCTFDSQASLQFNYYVWKLNGATATPVLRLSQLPTGNFTATSSSIMTLDQNTITTYPFDGSAPTVTSFNLSQDQSIYQIAARRDLCIAVLTDLRLALVDLPTKRISPLKKASFRFKPESIDLVQIDRYDDTVIDLVYYLYGISEDSQVECLQYFHSPDVVDPVNSGKIDTASASLVSMSHGPDGRLYFLDAKRQNIVWIDPVYNVAYKFPGNGTVTPLPSITFIIENAQYAAAQPNCIWAAMGGQPHSLLLSYRAPGQFQFALDGASPIMVKLNDVRPPAPNGLIMVLGKVMAIDPLVVVTELDIDPEKLS